jgi:organic hydroperoxide reductase OsmC/OhrA
MTLDIHMRVADGTDAAKAQKLRMAAEYGCVVLRTLREGVEVNVRYQDGTPGVEDGGE